MNVLWNTWGFILIACITLFTFENGHKTTYNKDQWKGIFQGDKKRL